jgi:hypothetical protein
MGLTMDDILTGSRTNRAKAEAKGYTKEVYASGGPFDLELLIMPGQHLDETFKAYDLAEEEYLLVDGWLFEFEDA